MATSTLPDRQERKDEGRRNEPQAFRLVPSRAAMLCLFLSLLLALLTGVVPKAFFDLPRGLTRLRCDVVVGLELPVRLSERRKKC